MSPSLMLVPDQCRSYVVLANIAAFICCNICLLIFDFRALLSFSHLLIFLFEFLSSSLLAALLGCPAPLRRHILQLCG
jgi:hypothetical protein